MKNSQWSSWFWSKALPVILLAVAVFVVVVLRLKAGLYPISSKYQEQERLHEESIIYFESK